MTEPDYAAELQELRRIYVRSTPKQRLHIILQRIDNPSHGPNLLVTHVSAVEAFARTLVMHAKATSKDHLESGYGRFRDREVKSLIVQYLTDRHGRAPADTFGPATWQRFAHAVNYRNLLVHECTYLGQQRYPQLIQACQDVLHQLAQLEGLLAVCDEVGIQDDGPSTPIL